LIVGEGVLEGQVCRSKFGPTRRSSSSASTHFATTDLWSGTKMWGHCISKPRLPRTGFNYIKLIASRCNDKCLPGGKLHLSRNRGDMIHTLEITDDQSTARRATHYGTQAQKIGVEDRASHTNSTLAQRSVRHEKCGCNCPTRMGLPNVPSVYSAGTVY